MITEFFINKQNLLCRYDYTQYDTRYIVKFYVYIDNKPIFIKEERPRPSKLEQQLGILKCYEYEFNDHVISLYFDKLKVLQEQFICDNWYDNFTYENINKIINNTNKIPYYKRIIYNNSMDGILELCTHGIYIEELKN